MDSLVFVGVDWLQFNRCPSFLPLALKMKLLRKKKILLSIIISIVVAVGLDMAIARSTYHPLKYLYQVLSWVSCKKVQCSFQATAPTKRQKGMVVTSHAEASRVGQEILLAGGNAIVEYPGLSGGRGSWKSGGTRSSSIGVLKKPCFGSRANSSEKF
jgi:hypothetical protein